MHYYKYPNNISSGFSGNSDANSLEFQDNLEEMIP